ncbi:MAG: hypothetical protein ABA06_02805 [Parcubacteria bacterium C7867-001]|nr:MAG: hypothetical protein ABA06_02805 [Parcubacteria bacterium C7867-001]
MRTLLFILAFLILPLGVFAANEATFTPLTQIPAFKEVVNAGSQGFAPFFNSLYKICIGIAAALAVLQIMRAGIMYLGPDSITEKKEARSLIGWSIFGLLIVLAPTIVFSVIDPRILDLKLDLAPIVSGTGDGGPKTGDGKPAGGDGGTGGGDTPTDTTPADEGGEPAGDTPVCDPDTEELVFSTTGEYCEKIPPATKKWVASQLGSVIWAGYAEFDKSKTGGCASGFFQHVYVAPKNGGVTSAQLAAYCNADTKHGASTDSPIKTLQGCAVVGEKAIGAHTVELPAPACDYSTGFSETTVTPGMVK